MMKVFLVLVSSKGGQDDHCAGPFGWQDHRRSVRLDWHQSVSREVTRLVDRSCRSDHQKDGSRHWRTDQHGFCGAARQGKSFHPALGVTAQPLKLHEASMYHYLVLHNAMSCSTKIWSAECFELLGGGKAVVITAADPAARERAKVDGKLVSGDVNYGEELLLWIIVVMSIVVNFSYFFLRSEIIAARPMCRVGSKSRPDPLIS